MKEDKAMTIASEIGAGSSVYTSTAKGAESHIISKNAKSGQLKAAMSGDRISELGQLKPEVRGGSDLMITVASADGGTTTTAAGVTAGKAALKALAVKAVMCSIQ